MFIEKNLRKYFLSERIIYNTLIMYNSNPTNFLQSFMPIGLLIAIYTRMRRKQNVCLNWLEQLQVFY